MNRFEGKTAVVTGAASGIGLALSEALGARGVRVVMADVDTDSVLAQAERLRSADVEVAATHVNVCEPTSVADLAEFSVDRFGGVQIVVNNAGIVGGGFSWELELEEWQRIIDVDLWGVVHGIRSFVPLLLASGEEGHVVNTASMAAVLPLARLGPYVVAKHGVLGLSDVLRAELASIDAPIGVSVVMPGMIRTAMNPIGIIEPEVVASKIVDAIRRDQPYVFTDDQATDGVRSRLGSIIEAKLSEGP